MVGGGENADVDRQVVAPTLFGQFSRRYVDGDTLCWELKVRIDQRAANALLALFNRGFWEPYDGKGWQATQQVHLYEHQWCIDALIGAGIDCCQFDSVPSTRWAAAQR